jgi:hypothetical protein
MALPEKWVPISIPPEFKSGAQGIAQMAGWTLKARDDGRWNVCLLENYENRPIATYTLERIVGATEADQQDPYKKLAELRGHDAYLTEKIRATGLERLKQLEAVADRLSIWEHFQVANTIATDDELPEFLRGSFTELAKQLPRASLWMIKVDRTLLSRKAASRAFFAAQEAPELLRRKQEDFAGFEAGRGLEAIEGLGMAPFLEVGLLAGAPGILGMVAARLSGMVLLLFGQYESGREKDGVAELIDMFRPELLSERVLDVQSWERPAPEVLDRYLRWWVDRVNEVTGLTVDPALFRKDDGTEDGSYDAASHFGFQISVDRLFATVKGILVGSRRDGFARSIFSFQALDLLSGMGLGNYQRLVSPKRVREDVEDLKKSLPAEVATVVMPRCERAARGLEKLRDDGFYLTERITQSGLRVRNKNGRWNTRPLDAAAADYINLVRDAGHSLGKKMRDPGELSLFVAHNGMIPPEMADVPYIHLIRLLNDPDILRKALRPVRRQGGMPEQTQPSVPIPQVTTRERL